MKHQNNNLSAYIITWAILVPEKGIVAKKDQRIISGISMRPKPNACSLHYATKNRAIEGVAKLKGRLSKEYRVYLVTDKQMGMMHPGQDGLLMSTLGHRLKITEKQIQDSFIIH